MVTRKIKNIVKWRAWRKWKSNKYTCINVSRKEALVKVFGRPGKILEKCVHPITINFLCVVATFLACYLTCNQVIISWITLALIISISYTFQFMIHILWWVIRKSPHTIINFLFKSWVYVRENIYKSSVGL